MSSSNESSTGPRNSLTPPSMPTMNTMSAADFKTIRKRNRVPLSCNFCRQRKLKCNRSHPCENCVKRGEESMCVYLVASNSSHSTSQASTSQALSPQVFASSVNGKKPAGAELQNRLDKLESLVLGLMNTTAGESESPEEAYADDSASPSTNDRNSNNGSSHRRPKIRSNKSTGELAPDVDAVRESLGMMKLDKKGKAMYHGETHWGALLNELSEVKALFEKSKQIAVDYPFQKSFRGDENATDGRMPNGFPFSNVRGIERVDIMELLPDKSVCDSLVLRYFDSFDPVYRVIHRLSFQQEYSDFWLDPDSADIVWIGMLFSMLSIALQSYRPGDAPAAFQGREIKTWMGWHQAAEMCLVEGKFMIKGSISIIRALILWLMAETRVTLAGCWMDRTWVSVGMIIRIAQSMGLHRDPKWFNISPFEAEIRRKMWSIVTSLDILFSINEGLPLTIRAGEHDVRMPLNLNDEDISPSIDEVPRSRPFDNETNSSYLLCSTKMSNVLCRIVSGTFSLRPRPGYDTILAHDAELRATFASFPEYLRIPPEASSPTDPPYMIMQRLMLDLQYRKSLIVLHRPFAARAQITSKFRRSKEECMDASLQILRRQNWLYHSPAARETLSMFSWFTDGLMLNHFFHACIMLSVELMSNMDDMSTFQRQMVRDAVDASRQILGQVGRWDMSAAKKHGLIEGLLERFYEVEKLTPEARAKLRSEALERQRKHQEAYPLDLPGVSETTINVDVSQVGFDSHSSLVQQTLKENNEKEFSSAEPLPATVFEIEAEQEGQGTMQIDSMTYDNFLPEEDEIYMDAPFRVRKLPGASWVQQMYGAEQRQQQEQQQRQEQQQQEQQQQDQQKQQQQHRPSLQAQADTTPETGSTASLATPIFGTEAGVAASLPNGNGSGLGGAGAVGSGARANANGSIGLVPEGTNGSPNGMPAGMFLPNDLGILSNAGAMMMTQNPGNDVPQGVNWMEWDMYIHGMVMNNMNGGPTMGTLAEGGLLSAAMPEGAAAVGAVGGQAVAPAGGLNPLLQWDAVQHHPGLATEASLMDTTGSASASTPGGTIVFDNGHANF